MASQTRIADHPQGHRIEFHPEPHHYILAGEKLESVTSRIHRWFPQFDAEAVARRKAEREGLHVETLLQLWERKRNQAASFGTKIHLMAERIIQAGDDRAADGLPENDRERRYLDAIKAAMDRVRPAYDFVETEKIVFSPELKVAGTIDILLRSKRTGEWVVADWKTNKEIRFKAFREEMGLGPCGQLPNCNFAHYSLQTSAYGELLARETYLPSETPLRGVLFHLREIEGRVICDFLKTKDLRQEARVILEAAAHSVPPAEVVVEQPSP